MKRIISVILCITIFFSTNVFAEDETVVIQSQEVIEAQTAEESTQEGSIHEEQVIEFTGTLGDYENLQKEKRNNENNEDGRMYEKTRVEVPEENESVSFFSDTSVYDFLSNSYTTMVKPDFLNRTKHPHLAGRMNREYISTFDGSLQLKYTDLLLRGRNGLDLEISRVFQSSKTAKNLYQSGYELYQAPTTYENKRFGLGLGWSLGFPSVEVHKKEDGTIQATYHDGTGNAYRSNYNDTVRDENGEATANGYYIYSSNLDNYPNDNVRFKERDRSYSRDGYRSYFSFTDENNITEYFSKTGEVIAVVDLFGNEIQFDYDYINGENLIPFSSYRNYVFGDFEIGTGFSVDDENLCAEFDGGTDGEKGSLISYEVPLDSDYDNYYASFIYYVPSEHFNKFDGEFSFYCDFYNEDDELVGSHLISHVIPTQQDSIITIGDSFSLSNIEQDEAPVKAQLRLDVDGKEIIQFDDFRLSPKNPMISKITDTIGRTVNFTYNGDLYKRYAEDEKPNYSISIVALDNHGNEIIDINYDRNIIESYIVRDEDGFEYDIAEFEMYYLYKSDNGDYTSYMYYDWFEGSASNQIWDFHSSYAYEFSQMQLVTITNRNSTTFFEYESAKKWLKKEHDQTTASQSTTGYTTEWRVTKRYDIRQALIYTDSPEKVNIQTFDYNSGFFTDETGHNRKAYDDDLYPGFLDPKLGTYKVVVTNPSGSIETYEYTTHIFDKGFRRIWEIELPLLDKHVLQEDTSSSADTIITEYTYTDNYALTSPNKVKVTETVNSKSHTYYTVNEYDNDSCLQTMTTLPLMESEISSIPKYKKVYTEYEKITNRFFVPISSKYYQSEDGEQLTQATQYDSIGRVISQTDAAGNVVYTEYNETYPWLVSRVWYSDPENIGDEDRISEVQYLYEDECLLAPTTTRTKSAENMYSETQATYDQKYGNVIKSVGANKAVTQYEYDKLGRIVKKIYPEYTSENEWKFLTEIITYSNDRDENYNCYFSIYRKIYSSLNYGEDPFGKEEYGESYQYDDYGNLLWYGAQDKKDIYVYDSANRVIEYQNERNYDNETITATYEYDNFGRITSATDVYGNTQYVDYNLHSNEYYFIPAESTTRENHYIEYFDEYKNLIKTESYPEGIDAAPVSAFYTYDLAGNVLSSTDGNGNQTTHEYDILGNNIKTTNPDGTIIETEYSKWGTAGKTTLTAGEKRYSSNAVYNDDRGLVTSFYHTGLEIDTKPWYYEYNEMSEPSKVVSPDGTVAKYTYDSYGNVTCMESGSRESEITYSYIDRIDVASEYESGTLMQIAEYTYDYYGRIETKDISAKYYDKNLEKYRYAPTPVMYYMYYNWGSPMLIDTGDECTEYSYDNADRISQVTFDDRNVFYEYYPDGMTKSIVYPNGITSNYAYDNANRLVKIVVENTEGILREYNYTYDGNGNMLSVRGSENVTYTYDSMNRLKSYTKDGTTTVYEYDLQNNLISETTGENIKTYEYGGDNRLHKVVENGIETIYEYDLNGNLIKCGDKEYSYDESNKLIYFKEGDTEYRYGVGTDGLRNVIYDTTLENYFMYDEAGNLFLDYDNKYVYGNSILAKEDYETEQYYYYILNGRGDVVALTDESGNIVNSYEYDPWGEITSQTETVTNGIKYSGEYYDAETGLIYLRNRYYDPSARRFTSEDPARDELNWYCYCGNNPVNFADPSGLAPTTKDAAEMAGHIYEHDLSNSKKDRTIAGWRLIDVWYGRESMKMGIYIPDEDDWTNPTEYAVVFKGTDNLKNWQNNIEAFLSSKSADVWDAINYSVWFDSVREQEITFVGHSKGGGEAIAAATATNKNAITFNAANFNFPEYGLTETNKSGIKNYYVKGEVLYSTIGYARYGTTQKLLSTQEWLVNTTIDFNIFGKKVYKEVKIPDPIGNHMMSAVKKALK